MPNYSKFRPHKRKFLGNWRPNVSGGEQNSSFLLRRQALNSFASDPEYAPFGKARQAGSVSNFHVIDDTDIAGAIPYLKAPFMAPKNVIEI
jgi:hypothetical protein